ncbi:hypothetical protein [Avibacterium paragallinarum]|uniref:hypothetical protein n=1 Tax=Avibacterium paragallinarum TaxID=728 RepID=UPI002ED7A43A
MFKLIKTIFIGVALFFSFSICTHAYLLSEEDVLEVRKTAEGIENPLTLVEMANNLLTEPKAKKLYHKLIWEDRPKVELIDVLNAEIGKKVYSYDKKKGEAHLKHDSLSRETVMKTTAVAFYTARATEITLDLMKKKQKWLEQQKKKKSSKKQKKQQKKKKQQKQ